MFRIPPRSLHIALLTVAGLLAGCAAPTARVADTPQPTVPTMPATMPNNGPIALPSGPFRVGFHVEQQYDRARVYRPARDPVTAQAIRGERARPLQTLVWYPLAANAAGAPMTYRDYIATIATEEDFHPTPAAARRATDLLIGQDAARLAALPQAMRALRDAPIRAGRFPVVIYAPSHGAYAMENADLCEYLAGQGYIVIASASLGPRSHAMTADLEGAEAQAADIGYLVGYAQTLAHVDAGRIAVVGYGWGGLASVLAAAKDDRIGALVSIDGALRAGFDYINGGPRAARYVTPERLDAPLLYITRLQSAGQAEQDDASAGTALLARLRYADVYLATIDAASPLDFSSWSLRMTQQAPTGAYDATARVVKRFLDAVLNNDADARRQLAADVATGSIAAGNAAAPGVISFALRRAAGPAPTMESFLAQLDAGGFEGIDAVYDRLHAQNADLVLDPLQARDWGLNLLAAGRARDAQRVLGLSVRLYPQRFDFLYDGLAQAQEGTGDRAAAIDNYRRALALEPGNAHARARLDALGAPN